MKRNSMTLLGAAILASGIFYVVNNPDMFTASILSLQEQEFIEEKWWDIAYKTDNGYVDIFLAEKREIPQKIDFTVSFDKDTVTIDPENLSGQGTRSYNIPDESNIFITSLPQSTLIKSESLIILPFTGESTDILLSEAIIDGKWASIGSLNEINVHSK